MIDIIMYGLVGGGFTLWSAWAIYVVLAERRRKRILNQQIMDGVVPVDYSNVVREFATQQNVEACGFTTAAQEHRINRLQALRMKVAHIRVEGFDAARQARVGKVLFETGISANPYEKGSGEAKQWARGFCQEACHPPKAWMERA